MAGELLVGADPAAALAAALDARFDGVATLCTDALGGAFLGVKWRAQVRILAYVHSGREDAVSHEHQAGQWSLILVFLSLAAYRYSSLCGADGVGRAHL